MCEKGYLKKIINKEIIHGIYLGDFPAKKCSFCGEIWTDGKTMEKIENIAKQKGIWGMDKKTKIIMMLANSISLTSLDKYFPSKFFKESRIA